MPAPSFSHARDAPDSGVRVATEELLALRPPFMRRDAPDTHPVHGLAAGDSRSREHGRGIEFDEVRPYRAGDDIRAIDWRASARLGRPFTKLFGEERERACFVAVDQRAGMFFGTGAAFKSVVAARAAALLCWSAHARGERVGGLVAGERCVAVHAHRARRGALQLIETLVEANRALSARSPAGVALERVLSDCFVHAPAGARVVLLSDFGDYGARLAPALAAIAERRTLSLVRVSDPLEETLDIAATVGISDGDARRTVRLGRHARARYLDARAARVRRLTEDAAACGAALSSLSTEDEPLVVLDGTARS